MKPPTPDATRASGPGSPATRRDKSADGVRAPAKLTYLWVAALALMVCLAGLRALPPLDRDEARFAQAAAQMLETGDFITIRFQDAERNKKPAGIYWMQAASVSMVSTVEARAIWPYRLPSVLGALLACWFTYLIGKQLFGPGPALLAAALLAAAPGLAAEATIAKTDAMLLASVTGALAGLVHLASADAGRARGWAYLYWTAIAVGILLKGPITPMVVGFATLGLIIYGPRTVLLARLRPISGLLIIAAIVAPWAILIGLETDGRFYAEALGGDMAGKLAQAQESHAGPPGYYIALSPILFWPAAALLPPGLCDIWRKRRMWTSVFLLSWLAPSWVVFELTATKLPHYTLPLYPALALIAARAACLGVAGRHRLWRRLGAAAFGAVGVGVAIALIAAPTLLSSASAGPACYGLAIIVLVLTAIAGRLYWKGRAIAGACAAIIASASVAVILLEAVLPRLDALDVSRKLATALEAAELHPLRNEGAAAPALAGFHEPSAVFLIGTKTNLTDGAGAAHHLHKAEAPTAAFVEARLLEGFQTEARRLGLSLKPVAEIEGLNYSKGDPVTLTLYVRRDGAPRNAPSP